MASLILGVHVSWYATVLWNRVSHCLPVSLAGQLVVFETVASLLYASVTDHTVPSVIGLGSMAVILGGVVLGARAISRPARGRAAAAVAAKTLEQTPFNRKRGALP